MSIEALDAYIVAAPGVETVVAAELTRLGIVPGDLEPGGVACRMDGRTLAVAQLHLRTASRVLVRLGEFHASAFYQLEDRARKLPWERYLRREEGVAFRVTSRASKLYHQKGVAERLASAAADRVPGIQLAAWPADDAPTEEAVQRVVVRLAHDRCLISVDASGPILHRRGYRLATTRAPLRETLAAALIQVSGWNGRDALVDPFCGSGTIPIEAALMARRIVPGLHRTFRCERWPEADGNTWETERARAREEVLPSAPAPLVGADRDAGAIAAARANAERAGVANDIEFRRSALSATGLPPGPCWVVTNPPYGARVGKPERLRDLYATLGRWVRDADPMPRVAMLVAQAAMERQTRLAWEPGFETTNGGIRVRARLFHPPVQEGRA